MCVSCAIDLLEVFIDNNVTGSELFSNEFFESASQNGTLPPESMFVMENGEVTIRLPDSFTASCSMQVNVSCPELVIINQTMELDYEIQGEEVHST